VDSVALTPNKTLVGEGCPLRLNVFVRNTGYHTETFTVKVYANATFAASNVFMVLSESSAICTLIWNASGFAKGNYQISVVADAVAYETDMTDNNCSDGVVFVTIAGDVNGDRKVDGKDVAVLAKGYNSLEGQPKYVANADITDDGKIDGKDIAILSKNYGKTEP